jgi:hypothetical protein
MNPVIKFEDYKKIGTMETALSKHADEAFLELSAERQKVAEKVFKCLTETDRENRVIRRATAVDKLCAVADADLQDVVAVIEVFRKEGRTFLMPPPEVSLNADSLIDISHESLIRKWGKLTKWVEEEGQSAQLYRRLAEDALLYSKDKVGFWSEPELSEALDWREDFKPNETWAELYREKGERQYKASFDDSMKYLDASMANRDAEVLEDEKQQSALRKYAQNLRRAFIGLVFVVLATIAVAAFAWQQRNAAIETQNALAVEKKNTDALNGELRVEKQNTDNAFKDLQSKKEELDESLKKQKEATDKAEEEKLRADTEAKHAILSETETEKALEQQKRLAVEASDATKIADQKRKEAEFTLGQLEASSERETTNRLAMVFVEQGEFVKAEPLLQDLLKSYQNEGDMMSAEARTDGKWWALHNLGIVNSKLGNFDAAHQHYISAINLLSSAASKETTSQRKASGEYFQKVSYADGRKDEINRSLVTTFRRLAQLYRMQAANATTETDTKIFNRRAVEAYGYLLDTLKKEPQDAKQPTYPAEVWVELADTFYDLYAYEEAVKLYKDAEKVYEDRNDYDNQVEVLKKWSDAELARMNEESVELLKKAVKIQEDKMNLSPVNLEIADTFDRLANAIRSNPGRAETNELAYYGKLFDLIRKVNFTAYNKIVSINDVDVKNLANAYIGIGKCKRAEKVYLFAIDKIFQPGDQSAMYILESKHHVYFFRDIAVFYQNVLHDDQNAQKYFDALANEIEKEAANTPIWDTDIYSKPGDFYTAKGNFARAENLYKYALRAVNASSFINKDYNVMSDSDRNYIIRLILTKADIIVKTARLYEAQNKLPEAEAKYLEAVNLINSKGLNFHPIAAKYLIAQADFYEKTGDKKKAFEIYTKAEAALKPGDGAKQFVSALEKKSRLEKTALEMYVQKKLGDFNRETNAGVAADHYKNALKLFDSYSILMMYQGNDKESTRYSSGDNTTMAYGLDWLEVLEALGSMEGVEKRDELKARVRRLREGLKDVKDFTCGEDKSN